MINLAVNPDSTSAAAQAMQDRRAWIIRGVLDGMAEGMQILAAAAADAAPDRTGKLRRAILASPTVKETTSAIVGTVSGEVGARHVALWVEEGINDPAASVKRAKAMVMSAGGSAQFFRSHAAFRVPAHPFMNPTLEEQKPQIMAVIQRHVEEALGGI